MRKKLEFKDYIITVFSILLIISLLFIENSKILVKDLNYDLKYQASKRVEESLEEIKKEKIARGIEINRLYDINFTGIIGEEFNGITTTLGSIEAKRTSANPNFAAVIVDMLLEAGLKSGDSVALNLSSSFPALNIATIIACEVLDLNPIIISSIGSSTWGGNNLDFTYVDMEEHLYNKGLISSKSIAISPGGDKDIGNDMNMDDLSIILDRTRNYGRKIILEECLSSNVNLRYNLYYHKSDAISCFINVGGNIVSFGDTIDSLNTPIGYIKDMDYKLSNKSGLVQKFNSENVPVIHLLNIKELSHRYGIRFDSDIPYSVGDGDVYYAYYYPDKLILLILILSFIFLFFYKKRINRYE